MLLIYFFGLFVYYSLTSLSMQLDMYLYRKFGEYKQVLQQFLDCEDPAVEMVDILTENHIICMSLSLGKLHSTVVVSAYDIDGSKEGTAYIVSRNDTEQIMRLASGGKCNLKKGTNVFYVRVKADTKDNSKPKDAAAKKKGKHVVPFTLGMFSVLCF